MRKTKTLFFLAILSLIPIFLASCSSGGSGSSATSPNVIITEVPVSGSDPAIPGGTTTDPTNPGGISSGTTTDPAAQAAADAAALAAKAAAEALAAVQAKDNAVTAANEAAAARDTAISAASETTAAKENAAEMQNAAVTASIIAENSSTSVETATDAMINAQTAADLAAKAAADAKTKADAAIAAAGIAQNLADAAARDAAAAAEAAAKSAGDSRAAEAAKAAAEAAKAAAESAAAAATAAQAAVDAAKEAANTAASAQAAADAAKIAADLKAKDAEEKRNVAISIALADASAAASAAETASNKVSAAKTAAAEAATAAAAANTAAITANTTAQNQLGNIYSAADALVKIKAAVVDAENAASAASTAATNAATAASAALAGLNAAKDALAAANAALNDAKAIGDGPTIAAVQSSVTAAETALASAQAAYNAASASSSEATTAANNAAAQLDNAKLALNTAKEAVSRQLIVIQPNSNGNITINGESISRSQYDPSKNASAQITAVKNGVSLPVIVGTNGDIIFAPAQAGSIDGTYTMTIATGDRIYTVIINVETKDGISSATVTSSVSYPNGQLTAIDLNNGKLMVSGSPVSVSSYGLMGLIYGYTPDSSIDSVTIKNSAGSIILWSVDSVTGDIIVADSNKGPYTVEIITIDGKVIVFTTNAFGTVVGNVTVSGRVTALVLDSGIFEFGTKTLTLTSSGSNTWNLASNVEILSVTAGASDAPLVNGVTIFVDSKNGNLLIQSNGTAVPSGPYTFKVKVGSELYIIKTDVSGNINTIIPGNILLQLTNGAIKRNDAVIVQVGVYNSTSKTWSLSGSITNVKAVNAQGASVVITFDPSTGNFVTTTEIAGSVTISFNYKDAAGNTITYTIIALNGGIDSYSAAITNPGPNFDFSTVTNVTVSLKVADALTGLPLENAKITFLSADKTAAWQGLTNKNGVSILSGLVATLNLTAKITVEHDGYYVVEYTVDKPGKIIEFGKNITMNPLPVAPPVVDADGDGVPAGIDADDGNAAIAVINKYAPYVMAFEDNYSNGSNKGGDRDFNDVVVKLLFTENLNAAGKITKITVDTTVLSALSGASNSIMLKVPFKANRVTLVANALTFGLNTVQTVLYNSATGMDRAAAGSIPFDPYMLPGGNTANGEVHLAAFNTTTYPTTYGYNGDKTDPCPWALMIPETWLWPNESTSIHLAYPRFKNWYMTKGAADQDWYNHPDTRYCGTRARLN